MNVITLAARKGGVGKTLLAASLAVTAALEAITHAGAAPRPDHGGVAVIDLDPQGSLTAWRNARPHPYPKIVEARPAVLRACLADLQEAGFRHAFVDTPPGHGDIVAAAIAVSDLTLVPVKPGELDLEAALTTLPIARAKRRPYALIPNDGTYRSRAMGRTITTLRERQLPVLPTVHHRVGHMLVNGLSAADATPSSKAAAEIRQLWRAVDGLFLADGGVA